MFKKLVLLPAILSIAGLLMAADSAFAQRGGGGRGGGGHGGGGHGGGGHMSGGHSGGHGGGHYGGGHGGGYYGGGHGGGYYGGGHGGGYYGGHHHGGYYGGGVYFGGLGTYGYDPWYDSYSYPSYSYYSAPPVQYYSAPTYVQPAPVVADFAYIRVIVPDPQARVWFDGNGTTSTGTERIFNSPTLTMGSTYNYQIRASWMQGGKEVSQVRTVSVTPGQTTVVDFSR